MGETKVFSPCWKAEEADGSASNDLSLGQAKEGEQQSFYQAAHLEGGLHFEDSSLPGIESSLKMPLVIHWGMSP